jgi:nucleotide-binding universal stress UspA family protein
MVPSLLILTDFFQAANRALDYATNLADPLGARLVLLHVRRSSVLDPEMLRGELSNLGREAINLALNSVARQLAVPVVAEVGYGRVAAAVADAVSRHHPELIVVGRPDYSTTPAELVETTSLDILRAAPYPMLLVPHLVGSSAPPRHLLLAVDGQPFDLGEHAGVVHRLLAEFRASLTVLHVAAHPDSDKMPPAALEAVVRAGLLLETRPFDIRTTSNRSPEAGILQEANPKEFDMIVIIARRHTFLGQLFHRSVTAQVLMHSELPVIVLPAL